MSQVRKVSVDAPALRRVLEALVSSPHLIRELQVTRGLPDNPIDTLVNQFNEAVAPEQSETPA